eukprot:TRINITY_DN16223_c0_g1_i1.p1 TRINITY_DN16223_c0_g1~~TRINITY_DN16223_c0_g1_i1.p1  ORF type:complete len:565 (-),score=101.44 TRINITY_DN16223_c0_g1_i1:495-2162(-)
MSDTESETESEASIETAPSCPDRVTISKKGKYILNGKEIVLMGGNYGLKAPPYLPPIDVVKEDAKIMADGAEATKFKPPPAADGSQRRIVPMVRLNLYFEAAMPSKGKVDEAFANHLDAVVSAFKAEGVYVMLDNHEDALSTVNGGEGWPWWIFDEMQNHPEPGFCGCALPECCHCCSCCSFCCSCCGPSWYYVSPTQPLENTSQCHAPCCCFKPSEGYFISELEEDDPWRAFSIGSNTGNPARMNIGNINMRLNNPGSKWGNLSNSKQANNGYTRILGAPFHNTDRGMIFEPFMTYIKLLARVWERHHNVVALGLWNEPMVPGLPLRFWNVFCAVRRLYDWQAAIAEELDKEGYGIPLALEELPQGSLTEFTWVAWLFGMVPMSSYSRRILQAKARRCQIILEFHLYEGPLMPDTIPEGVEKAKRKAMKLFGESVPVYVGEFWPGKDGKTNEEAGAHILAKLAESGCDAMSYWFYSNLPHCDGNDGWYKYPKHIHENGPLIINDEVNMKVWPQYLQTVHDETFWGARITGASSACGDLVKLLPEKAAMDTKINS